MKALFIILSVIIVILIRKTVIYVLERRRHGKIKGLFTEKTK